MKEVSRKFQKPEQSNNSSEEERFYVFSLTIINRKSLKKFLRLKEVESIFAFKISRFYQTIILWGDKLNLLPHQKLQKRNAHFLLLICKLICNNSKKKITFLMNEKRYVT